MLTLDNITLLPAEVNNGKSLQSKFNFGVQDIEPSLPIFTSPMSSIVGKSNWKVWQSNGIKPIIPRTEPLEIRLEACCYIFAAFSKEEVKQNFLLSNRRSINSMFRICIDAGNGHDVELFNIGKELKRMYGPQVLLMGGNIGNPKTYINYCKAEFDYVRVGLSSGSLVDTDKYGFNYPMATLLIDIKNTKNTVGVGLKHTKIIADGGIKSYSHILKCLTLGADYVMIGREFAKLVEANGEVYREVFDNKTKRVTLEPQNKEEIVNYPIDSIKRMGLVRVYSGNTSIETQALMNGFNDIEAWKKSKNVKLKPSDAGSENISVNNTLGNWLKEMYDCFNYHFIMTSSIDWKSYSNNSKYLIL